MRREDKDLVVKQIDFQGVHVVFRVGSLLIFQQPPQPLIIALRAVPLPVVLVLPMRRHAVLGDFVHLLRADLDLERHGPISNHSRMQRLVAVGLRRADIVPETPRHRLVSVVNHPKDVVAVRRSAVYNHPESNEIKNLLQRLVL